MIGGLARLGPIVRTVAVVASVAIAATGCGGTRFRASSSDEVLQRLLPATVQILLEGADGRFSRTASGVAIAALASERGRECFVLTSGHAVAPTPVPRETFVVFDRHLGEGVGTRAPATVLAWRETAEGDLAILRAVSPRCAPARLGQPPRLGAAVWVIGFPWGRHLTLASGVVSQINATPGPADGEGGLRLMVDASVSYGLSGGGVFEARTGRLIGLVEGYRTARVTSGGTEAAWSIDLPIPGQTFVTSLADIRRFLTESGYLDLVDGTTSGARVE